MDFTPVAFLDLFRFSLQEISDEPSGWLPRWLDASVDFISSGRQARRYAGNLQE